MLHGLKVSGVIIIFFALLSCNNTTSEKTAGEQQTAKELPPSSNPDGFNQSFSRLLTAYLSLRDALVDWDTASANRASADVARLSDSLDLDKIANDTNGVAKKKADNFAGTINGSAKALAGENDIQAKRKEFYMISEALFDLAKAAKYDRETLYRVKCPMAFNESQEAFWVSNRPEIKNPYLGNKHPKFKNKMLECGELTDSIGRR